MKINGDRMAFRYEGVGGNHRYPRSGVTPFLTAKDQEARAYITRAAESAGFTDSYRRLLATCSFDLQKRR